jgi:hypothetical protein
MNELQQLIQKFTNDLKVEVYNSIQTLVDTLEARQTRIINNLYLEITRLQSQASLDTQKDQALGSQIDSGLPPL